MPAITVRHFTEADIPLRTALLREPRFQANLTDFAVVTDDDALDVNQRRTLTEEHSVKRMFALCAPDDTVVGFAWITSIDWRAQVCEISFGILPEHRGVRGAAAVHAAHAHIRSELNMRVTIGQVLEHNNMLHSAERLVDQRQVRTTYDSYTVGQWRTACYWAETEEDVQVHLRAAQDRRDALADRIRAMTRRTT